MQPVDWSAADIPAAHHRLFVLQWAELFGEDYLDTWQVRTSNIIAILGEIEEVTRVAREDYAPVQAALPSLLDEALGVLERDHVVNRSFPSCREAVALMKRDLSAASESLPLARLEEFARRSRVLREQLSRRYREDSTRYLRETLSGAGQQNEEQLFLTMTFATELARLGFSLQHLRGVGQGLLIPGRPFLDRFDELVDLCGAEPRTFEVFFIVREWARGIEPARVGTSLCTRDEAKAKVPDSPRAREFFDRAIPADAIVSLKVEALDPFGARVNAEARLMNDFAAIAFVSRQHPILAAAGEALVLDESNIAVLAPADGSRRAALQPSHDWRTRASNLLGLESVLRPDDLHQVSATLQYFRLAVSHSSDEVRLVNLWVSAETLVRGAAIGSTLTRVGVLAPVLALRNVRRVAKGLARRLTRTVRFKHLRRVGVLEKGAKLVDPSRLLDALKDPVRGPELLGLLEHDPLLRFRLYRFAEKALKSGTTAANYLEQNERNIRWQLARIYRARNALVHRGEPQQSTRQLLQHLETYVWTAIRQVAEQLTVSEGRWSVGDCLEHFRSTYDHTLRVLKASQQPPLRALVEPSLFLEMPVPQQQPPAKRT